MFKKIRLWMLEQQVNAMVAQDSGKKESTVSKTTKKTVAKKWNAKFPKLKVNWIK